MRSRARIGVGARDASGRSGCGDARSPSTSRVTADGCVGHRVDPAGSPPPFVRSPRAERPPPCATALVSPYHRDGAVWWGSRRSRAVRHGPTPSARAPTNGLLAGTVVGRRGGLGHRIAGLGRRGRAGRCLAGIEGRSTPSAGLAGRLRTIGSALFDAPTASNGARTGRAGSVRRDRCHAGYVGYGVRAGSEPGTYSNSPWAEAGGSPSRGRGSSPGR